MAEVTQTMLDAGRKALLSIGPRDDVSAQPRSEALVRSIYEAMLAKAPADVPAEVLDSFDALFSDWSHRYVDDEYGPDDNDVALLASAVLKWISAAVAERAVRLSTLHKSGRSRPSGD